jgi:hypothetical protein
VSGDCAVAGRIDLLGLSVANTLVQPAGAPFVVVDAMIGMTQAQQVLVPPPCPCGESERIDIAQVARDVLEGAGASSDCDGGVGLAPGDALFVEGDLHREEGLSLQPAAPAELALVVEGNVRIEGPLTLGDASAATTVDLLVGGSGTIRLAGGGEIHGVLYAPQAELVLLGPLTVHGAVFVARVSADADAELTVIR